VTVRIHDNGGTANGGVDTSAPQTFTITVIENPLLDDDGDGCTNSRERGTNITLGGMRSKKIFWDFFDVPNPPLLQTRQSCLRD
jgi:hypothetical protein